MSPPNGFTSRRSSNAAHGGDSIGTSRAQALLPIRFKDQALLSDLHGDDLYLRGTRKLVVKWHDGFEILEARRYRGCWTVRLAGGMCDDAPWSAAIDVDLRARKVDRFRGIGTATMAIVHRTRTEAEVTIDRYLYARGDQQRRVA